MHDEPMEPGLGEQVRGRAAPPPELGWGHTWAVVGAGIVPPYPGATFLPPPTPPPPPRLDGGDTMDEWCALVLATWAAGVARYWPRKRVRAYSHDAVTPGGKQRALLEAACWALFEEQAPPAMWIRFQLDGWFNRPPEGVNPRTTPMRWQLALHGPSIRKHAAWFQRESGTYGAASSGFGPKRRALLHNHGRMVDALVVSAAETPDALREVVARFFPPGAWETMVRAARAEAAAMQETFNVQMRRGEWPW